jgi:hypothetical protein
MKLFLSFLHTSCGLFANCRNVVVVVVVACAFQSNTNCKNIYIIEKMTLTLKTDKTLSKRFKIKCPIQLQTFLRRKKVIKYTSKAFL